MTRFLHNLRKNVSHGIHGQIFVLVLIFLTMGILLITPLLGYIGTGTKTGTLYEKRTDMLYAADSGIEDAKWKIEYDKLPSGTPPSGYSAYDFDNAYVYTIGSGNEIGENINENSVTVKIMNVWIPPESIIPRPGSDLAQNIIESNKLVASGATSRIGILVRDPLNPLNTFYVSEYKMKIVYARQTENLDALKVENIGIWLPSGFEYFSDPTQTDLSSGNPFVSNLEYAGLPGLYRSTPIKSISSGNETVIWSYSDPFPSFAAYPSEVLTSNNSEYCLEIKFFYKSIGNPSDKPDAVAWVKTNGDKEPQVEHIPFSWNADVRVFHIQTTAGNTVVDAFVPKNEVRETRNTIAGDYWVTGNTLMKDAIPDSCYIRDTWLQEDISIPGNSSSNSIPPESSRGAGNGIPTNAEVKQAYLYWTSWYGTKQARVPTNDGDSYGMWNPVPSAPTTFYDKVDETNPDNPRDSDYFVGTVASAPEIQTRFPDGEFISSGTWSVFPSNPNTKYDKVDESPSDTDTTYLTLGVTTGISSGYVLFTFPRFSVPQNAAISSLTIGYVSKDESIVSSNNLRAAVRVGETNYLATDSGANPGSGYSLRTYNFPVNPDTGSNWTVNEINGIGSNHLVAFGLNSTDANPPIRTTQVYAQVNYVLGVYQLFDFTPFTVPQGATISDLTVVIRARDEITGTNNIRPCIKVGGTNYNNAFPGNNPDSDWSANNTFSYVYALNPHTGLAWTVEDINGAGGNSLQEFGIFSSDLEPGIRISLIYAQVNYILDPIADTSVYFKIDNKLVYFDYVDLNGDGSLDPVPLEGLEGNEQITADQSQIITSTQGFSYACRKDVTDLILKFAEADDGEIDEAGKPIEDGYEGDDLYRPGIGRYTVGGVDGTLGDNNPSSTQLSHAGWALVLIYTSPSNYVNQIYLYDITNVGFLHAFDANNLDFDGDGEPGGTIQGFIVPERIFTDKDKNGIPDDEDGDGEPEEENAAKMTVFVGEGDDFEDGDYIEFNGISLPDEAGSDGGDVWNGLSNLFAEDGVDIDTFYVAWTSNLLQFGDISAQVDMHTGADNWNLVFTILSFRSVPSTGGTLSYQIH